MNEHFNTIVYLESTFAGETLTEEDDWKGYKGFLVKEYNKAKPVATFPYDDNFYKQKERKQKDPPEILNKFERYISLKSEPYKEPVIDDLGLDPEHRERLNKWIDRRVTRLENEVSYYRKQLAYTQDHSVAQSQDIERLKAEIRHLKETGIFPLEKPDGNGDQNGTKCRIDLRDLINTDLE